MIFGLPDFPSPSPVTEALHDLEFSECAPGSVTDGEILTVTAGLDEALETIQEKVRAMLVKRCWWLQHYWRTKVVRQMVSITAGPVTLSTFVFGAPLESWHIETLLHVTTCFLQLRNGCAFRDLRFLLCDDVQYHNTQNGEPALGYAGGHETILLFPAARSNTPYRLPTTTKFEGAAIHEFAHKLHSDQQYVRSGADALLNRWKARFRWTSLPSDGLGRVLPGGACIWDTIEEPARCVTDYGRSCAADDFCESLVAALTGPDLLDPERLRFLREEVIPPTWKKLIVRVQCVEGTSVAFPALAQPVRYVRRPSRVRVV
ncbi:MAG: hypothetical protein Q8R32_02240 [bacterium]|nr:hypothetical protein [bacterium]